MKIHRRNPLLGNAPLPCEMVFAPDWWFASAGITFDEDFFFDPRRRVADERRKVQVLAERFSGWGLDDSRGADLPPQVGAVHLAAGFMIDGMMGCEIEYHESAPPTVHARDLDSLSEMPGSQVAVESSIYKKWLQMVDTLKQQYGRVEGDVNWGGPLNVALNLRGQNFFIDMIEHPKEAGQKLEDIAQTIEAFTTVVFERTGSTSISVNRTLRHFSRPVFLHSECSHTMIDLPAYRALLQPIDKRWSREQRPFGIHYCGGDADRFAQAFAELPALDFVDVGWGSDIATLRQLLPDAFLNIRYCPVAIIDHEVDEIRQTVRRMVDESGNPHLTGVCCVNMDRQVEDRKVVAILEEVRALRDEFAAC